LEKPNLILLAGFMDFSALNQRLQIEMGNTFDENTAAHHSGWKTRNDFALNTLPKIDQYRPSDDVVSDIRGSESKLKEKRDKVRLHPPYDVIQFEFKLVDVTRVVPAQLRIDLQRVEAVSKLIGKKIDFDGLLDICLDTEAHEVEVTKRFVGQTLQNYAQLTTDADVRLRGVELRDVPLSEPGGGPLRPGKAKGLVFLLSLGDPFIMAFRFHIIKYDSASGKEVNVPYVILANGYHRAYALWQAGWRKLPCVFADISVQELKAFVPDPDAVLAFASGFARPPLFKDFFEPKLTMNFHVPHRKKVFTIQWTANIGNSYEERG